MIDTATYAYTWREVFDAALRRASLTGERMRVRRTKLPGFSTPKCPAYVWVARPAKDVGERR